MVAALNKPHRKKERKKEGRKEGRKIISAFAPDYGVPARLCPYGFI